MLRVAIQREGNCDIPYFLRAKPFSPQEYRELVLDVGLSRETSGKRLKVVCYNESAACVSRAARATFGGYDESYPARHA